MRGQKDYFGSVLFGLGGIEPVTVRETLWGFIIQSANPGGSWRYVMERAARLAKVGVWLAVIGLWLIPASQAPEVAYTLKAIASVVLLVATHAALVLTRRMGGYAVHVDSGRRELRTAIVTAKGQSWIKASFRFDEIGEAVLERGRNDTCAHSLVLRLKTNGQVIQIAVGDEASLLGVHDRLMRDLRPLEERMAANGFLPKPQSRRRRMRAFPMLGPEESLGRGRRAISA